MIDPKAGFSPQILGDVLAMRMGRSVAGTVRKFVPDPRVAQMLDHFTQYVGSCPEPRRPCSAASPTCRRPEGIWYPRGGTRAVPEALVKLGDELGVEYRTDTGIAPHPDRDDGNASRGVETDAGEVVELAAVVSNADSVRTHRELLSETAPRAARRFESRREYEPACSGVVLYLGLNKAYDHLLHHDFVFSRDPARGVRLHLPQGRTGPGPDLLPRVDRPHRTGNRPARRRRAVRARAHAVPAAAPRLEADAARVSPRHPEQAEDDREDAGHREPHRLSNRR